MGALFCSVFVPLKVGSTTPLATKLPLSSTRRHRVARPGCKPLSNFSCRLSYAASQPVSIFSYASKNVYMPPPTHPQELQRSIHCVQPHLTRTLTCPNPKTFNAASIHCVQTHLTRTLTCPLHPNHKTFNVASTAYNDILHER